MPRDGNMLGVQFSEERFSDLRTEGAALFEAHWREAATDHAVPLDVNWDAYRAFEDVGGVVTITARRGGELVGYAVYIVAPHPRYRSLIVADSDVFFLRPADRRGRVGIELFRYAERVLLARGVRLLTMRIKLHVRPGRGRSTLEPLARRLGYRPIELLCEKRVR
jgi:GNAT superfamily N-acetyltransferase